MMMKVFEKLFAKKNDKVSTYSQLENLLVNLTGDVNN